MENNNGVPSVSGWHADPDDPNYIRYSNGRNWVGERVLKQRQLTLENNKVYRPASYEADTPSEQIVEKPAPSTQSSYQPMTRRERRKLEEATSMNNAPVEGFEEEFEFQSAPATKSYTPEVAPPATSTFYVPTTFHLDDEDLKPQDEGAEVAAEEEARSAVSVDASDDFDAWGEDDNESSLPELNFGGDDFIPEKIPTDTVSFDDEKEDDDDSAGLPSLSLDDESDDEDIPAPVVRDELPAKVDESDDNEFTIAESLPEEDETFSSSDTTEEYSKPYAFAAPAPVVEKEKVVEEESEAREAEVAAPVKEDVAPVEEREEPKVDTKEADEDDFEEVVPAYGFKSKLNRNWGKEDQPAAETALAAQPDQPEIAKIEEKIPVAPKVERPVVDSEEANDEDDEDDEPREGLGDKIKSLFSRKQKPVLDEDENDENEVVASEAEPETAKPAVPIVSEEPKKAVKSVEVADDKPEKYNDEDEVEDEEPQLKAGLFSSRQEKEDAATEVELISRLKEVAGKVAALKTEEAEIAARIAKAREDEEELKQLILKAHEEHELLDQLAITRRKEIDTEHSEKEDKRFREFLETHGSSVVEPSKDELPEPKVTTALPIVHEAKVEESKEEDEENESSLPELKFN